MRDLWSDVNIGISLQIRLLAFQLLAVPVGWYLLWWTDVGSPEGQWLWIEAILIPLGVFGSMDAFVGRYERRELEPFLARRTARSLYLILILPVGAVLMVAAMAVSTVAAVGGPLEAAARTALMFGMAQLLLVLSRNRWFAISLFSLWWLFAIAYMQDWAVASDATALWHPLRLSGGGAVNPALEWKTLLVGLGAWALSWIAVGKEARWLN